MIATFVRRLLCRLGAHGPYWGGYGIDNQSPSNYSIGPGFRRCAHCGAEWVAYEVETRKPHRVLEWARVTNKGAR